MFGASQTCALHSERICGRVGGNPKSFLQILDKEEGRTKFAVGGHVQGVCQLFMN